MMRILFISLVFLIVDSGCRKSENFNSIDKIPVGQCAATMINGESVSICYNKLLEDSRCPKGMACIWQGVARGSFSFKAKGQVANFELSTLSHGNYRRDTVLFGYKIHLVDLSPYPGEPARISSANVQISQ